MIIYYIRHGDPIYEPDSLTDLGVKQASAVAKRLSLSGIDEIYSSPSVRALKTAEPLSELIKKPITVLNWCDEGLAWQDFHHTDEDGRKKWMFDVGKVREKFAEKKILDMRNDWYKDPFFEERVGRGVGRVNTLVDGFLAEKGYVHDRESGLYYAEKPSDKRIAIFAHFGFGMIFLSSLLDIPYPVVSTHLSISHSGVSVINFGAVPGEKVFPTLLQLSNDSHLYKEGLPTKYNNEILI